MSDSYQQLLDATIQHLQELKARGVRFVPVTSERLTVRAVPPAPRQPHASPARAAAVPSVKSPGFPTETRTPATPLPTGTTTFAIPSADRAAAYARLRERVLACVKCPHLAASRKNVVFGVGNLHAELMFVGEAPGADEDKQGEPFVGKAGQYPVRRLTEVIDVIERAGVGRMTSRGARRTARRRK
jgi:DNA polymerase